MKVFYLVLIMVCLTACQDQAANSNSNTATDKTSSSPSPKPSLSKEELNKKNEEEKAEQSKAINDFIAKSYKGWQLKGISNELGECQEYETEPCNLLLVNGQQEKVVAVMFKRFTLADGQKQLVVFEARPIDLSKAKIEQLKAREKEAATQELADAATDSYSDDREPYDPR